MKCRCLQHFFDATVPYGAPIKLVVRSNTIELQFRNTDRAFGPPFFFFLFFFSFSGVSIEFENCRLIIFHGFSAERLEGLWFIPSDNCLIREVPE